MSRPVPSQGLIHDDPYMRSVWPLKLVGSQHEIESRGLQCGSQSCFGLLLPTRVYSKVSGLATWSENYKWCSSLPLGAVVSLFCESI
jgi:hypothetical protein